ncbi:MAG TPA: BTAD domain-containing putative transcriptional regulator [Kribbella sp.]|jgi:DNA-binding SARP family transcriptional activator
MLDDQVVDYRLDVLGRFRLRRGTRQLTPRPSCRRLLGLLAVRGSLHRMEASEALWPGLTERQSQSNLRTVLWRLREQGIPIIKDDNAYLSLTGLIVDLGEVVRWCHASLSGHGFAVAPPEGIARDVLPGWTDSWLLAPREELQTLRLHALDAVGGRFLLADQLGEAGKATRAAAQLDPLRESSTRLLLEVYLREGNAIDAVRLYQDFASRLRDELGLDPEPQTTALVSRVAFSGSS